MRILHTSDWHIGRTFHGHSTMDAVGEVLGAIPALVREHEIDVVIAAGDIFDAATPSADAFELLKRILLEIRAAGARLVITSGNHDSAARLGFPAPFAELGGVWIATDPARLDDPIAIDDEHGTVDFYAIPFLEPALLRHRYPDETLRSQADALRFAMRRIRAVAQGRDNRTVVVAHSFVAGGEAESADSERAITVGTVDVVPLSTFAGIDYVALGHVHGRARLAEGIRYSGAVLHYSFSEAGKPRGGWLVDLAADGATSTRWLELPVPRALAVLTGPIDELLTDRGYADHENDWVSAVLTDQSRPTDAMRRLQTRFPWCANIEFRPAVTVADGAANYASRVQGKTDAQVIESFLLHVRNGEAATPAEDEILRASMDRTAATAAGA